MGRGVHSAFVAFVMFGSVWLVESLTRRRLRAVWRRTSNPRRVALRVLGGNPITRPLATFVSTGAGWRHGFEIFARRHRLGRPVLSLVSQQSPG